MFKTPIPPLGDIAIFIEKVALDKCTAVAVVLFACLGFLGAKAYHNLASFKSTETVLRAAVVQQCEKNPKSTPRSSAG